VRSWTPTGLKSSSGRDVNDRRAVHVWQKKFDIARILDRWPCCQNVKANAMNYCWMRANMFFQISKANELDIFLRMLAAQMRSFLESRCV
jgi:hypothetical protein